jgi:hypothetical protein
MQVGYSATRLGKGVAQDSFFNLAVLQVPERSLNCRPDKSGRYPPCAYQRIKGQREKRLDTIPRVRALYVSYMSWQSNRTRTLTLPWAWPQRGSGAVWRRRGDPAPAGPPHGGVKPPPLHHYLLRAELDKGRLKVEPAGEINLTENTGLSAFFRCELKRRVPVYINSQDEGDSHNFIEN